MSAMGSSMINSMGAAALSVAFFVTLYGTAAALGGAITRRQDLIRSSMYSVYLSFAPGSLLVVE